MDLAPTTAPRAASPLAAVPSTEAALDAQDAQDARLREAAVRLEAGFLREMLEGAGLGRPPAGFGGGAGEEQFASFLLDAQAERLARSGGIGLAELIVRALGDRDAG